MLSGKKALPELRYPLEQALNEVSNAYLHLWCYGHVSGLIIVNKRLTPAINDTTFRPVSYLII